MFDMDSGLVCVDRERPISLTVEGTGSISRDDGCADVDPISHANRHGTAQQTRPVYNRRSVPPGIIDCATKPATETRGDFERVVALIVDDSEDLLERVLRVLAEILNGYFQLPARQRRVLTDAGIQPQQGIVVGHDIRFHRTIVDCRTAERTGSHCCRAAGGDRSKSEYEFTPVHRPGFLILRAPGSSELVREPNCRGARTLPVGSFRYWNILAADSTEGVT